MQENAREPFPPFTLISAKEKVQMAENGWNLCNPNKIALAYSVDSQWRNRDQFISGREEIIGFLEKKYEKELEYKLCKELWAYTDNKIAVRFAYEWHDKDNQWWRSYGNENWEFNELGLMCVRFASINDLAINNEDRKLLWNGYLRPKEYPSLSDMGL